ncbi:transporter substrate-binding domain-containing protein [Roseobacter sp. YSTF-M11]|uniref:Transporter substrate-binding domain-containing protein n=1 Tax=Roseobacter insulae TaxID=2859783 RepID=A0A9X1K0N6_9RHOB|nr:transporter substrate-binding domain-containing protein [Roseobacter insulae]MBW4706663.1 transporter substrate-binding domain-containing protein [Roseobacter insulae]
MIRFLTVVLIICAFVAGPILAQPTLKSVALPDQTNGRLEHILRRGALIVGVKTDYPPWGMLDAQGRIIGLEPDLARALADRMGVDLELVAVTASNRLSRVNQGVVDVVIATMGDTVTRRGQAGLLEPSYYSSGVVAYGPIDRNYQSWEELRGLPVCMTQGSYYNRTLEETYGVDGKYFPANREAKMALSFGRCVGWAFDDTALVQRVLANPETNYSVMEDRILVTPWAIGVAIGERDAPLGRFVSDMIGEWHATGYLLALERKWNIGESAYLQALNAAWSQTGPEGTPSYCNMRQGALPPDCLGAPPFPPVAETGAPPPWVADLEDATGVDLTVFYDAYSRGRLIRGLGLTLTLSAVAIIGALVVGLGLGVMDASLRGRGLWARMLLLPQKALVTLARMTPPILQMYIVFFGLGGVLSQSSLITPGAFTTAALILSLYAGSTNAVLIAHALEQERRLNPEKGVWTLLPGAFQRAFDGLVAACVNIVKAAGMASAIALAELVSTVNLIVSEGGDVSTFMNGLLVFYFLLVLGVLWLFRRARRWVVGTGP